MTKIEFLSDYFTPKNYNLTFDIDRKNRTLVGKNIITGQLKSGNKIKLHANYLQIKSVVLNGKNTDFIYNNNILEVESNQNTIILEINYSGIITDQMTGLYPSYYKYKNQDCELLSTQFESHYAREVFPCVDEPIAKATFDITLITEQNVEVLSNADIKKQTKNNDKLITEFKTTPKMSTYLLAFVIGDLQKIEATTKNGSRVRIFSTRAQTLDSMQHALEIAIKSQEWYESYLGVPYPLEKCDHIAIPDFAAGAMENWGLITYRESMLLADKNSTPDTFESTASTIVHELAHMWFGNLVTMKWWDELWLNESLATMMQYKCLDAIKPEYAIWQDFFTNEYNAAKSRDAYENVQPVWTAINHEDEIQSVFDGAIVYAKGASIMLMLMNYIGEEVFQESLHQYLSTFKYDNPSSYDLLSFFRLNSGFDATEFMNKWLKTPGYPILNVSESDRKYKIEQANFGYKSENTWPVPLYINNKFIFNNKQMVYEANEFTVLNHGIKSFFITKYDDQLNSKVLNKIKNNELCELDNLNYLMDQRLLAEHHLIEPSELIDILIAYRNNSSYVIWQALSAIIANIKFYIEDDATESKFKEIINKITKPLLDKIGIKKVDKESINNTKLRPILFSLVSYSDDLEIIEFSKQEFTKDLSKISNDIRASIIANNVKHNYSNQMFNKLFNQYAIEQNQDLKYDLLAGLSAVKNPDGIDIIIKNLLNKKLIKPQDLLHWYIYMLRNKYSKQQTWNWLENNFTKLTEIYSENKEYSDFARYSAPSLKTENELQKFNSLFDNYKNDFAMKRTLEIAQVSIKNNIELFSSNIEKIQNKLNSINENLNF